MPTSRSAAQLSSYQRRYRELAAQLSGIGWIASGSVVSRHNRCGKPRCRCHGDPPRLHGPYWQWTAKTNGKTVNRRLSESEAQLYQGWITNDRRLHAIIDDMRQIAAKATELILEGVVEPSNPGV